jgi:hypothetical protein
VNDDQMTIDEVLAGLPRSNPDAAGSQRVRRQCHRALNRRSRPSGPRVRRATTMFRRTLESALVGGFCAAYLSLLTLMALRTHGVL